MWNLLSCYECGEWGRVKMGGRTGNFPLYTTHTHTDTHTHTYIFKGDNLCVCVCIYIVVV